MALLIWKEWREQRWRIGFGCVVLCAFALIGLHTRAVDDHTILVGTCALGVLLLPILAAAALIPAEREERTIETLLALPVAPWKALAAKTLLGAALCAIPLIAAAAVSVAETRGREISVPGTLEIFARSIASALCLFVWMLGLSARSEGEGRAAALSVGVLAFWLMATFALGQFPERAPHMTSVLRARLAQMAIAPTPLVFVFADEPFGLIAGVVLQLAFAAVLWRWAARSFAAGGALEGRS